MRAKTLIPNVFSAALLAMPVAAEDLTFLLVNESGADLVEFNVSKGSSSSWEENLLEGGYLASGYEIDVLIAGGATTCVYDIRGRFSDGTEAEDFYLGLCELGAYAFTD